MRIIFKNWKIVWLIIAIVSILITLFLIFNGSKNKQVKINDNKVIQDNNVDKNSDYKLTYQIFEGENPNIKLYISSEKGIVKIVYPDGQIGEYDNKVSLETFYNIDKNGEYLFEIHLSNGEVIKENVIVDILSDINMNEEQKLDDESSNIQIQNDDNGSNTNTNSNITNNKTNINSNNNNSSNTNNNTNTTDNKTNINTNNNNSTTNNTNSNDNDNSANTNNNSNNTNDNTNNTKPVIEDKIIGTIYFNKPIGWTNSYLYITFNGSSVVGEFPGISGRLVDDNIYAFDIMESMGNVNNLELQFNNGKYYKSPSLTFPGLNKLYNITLRANSSGNSTGEWIDYDVSTIVNGGPVNRGQIKNVIFMIGDGMGVNHIEAGKLYKGSNLVFTQFTNTYVSTYSKSNFITDSAASATALATGNKTINYYVGIDYYGNKLETLAEYAHKKGLKTGLVATQTINHATPAGFSAHNYNRSNYDDITIDQVNSGIDLMLGGGTNYFSKDNIINLMDTNGYAYITNFSDIYNIDKNEKVIGAFSPGSFHETSGNLPSLEEMTSVALNRLDSNSGFFLMVEGSNIDTYSHQGNLINMLIELVEFDKAVGIAKNYVDNHPDTLLIITADHETGGLNLGGAYNQSSLLSNAKFTSSSNPYDQAHTASFVKVYTYGVTKDALTRPSLIDNTYIHNYVKQGLVNKYGY